MSCDWSVACLDCDEDIGITDANHCEVGARRMAADAHRLATVPGLVIDIQHTYGICGYPPTAATDWFLKHAGHRIRARNEYGEVSKP